MRYRAETPDGDYVFGAGSTFLVDSPAAVAQAIKTRLKLFAGEWFLDSRIGLDKDRILGTNTQGSRDQEVQRRILGTPGVKELVDYQSTVGADRSFVVAAKVSTIYGVITLSESF